MLPFRFDWGLVRSNPTGPRRFVGKTNLEAAKAGITPEMADGSIINLHHVGQHGHGPLAEVTTLIHNRSNKKMFDTIHGQFSGKSDPNCPVIHDRTWDTDRISYWIGRSGDVTKK
ncbi:hypothetical protein AGMMS49949_09860 [Alphaproteobacteria bacterium]|nr:hypothetical protein AGMMS49949_09860 [Alphaproteobacteria bacterium]GHT00805.1 hypothetical protein AGMMS50296_9110 [Alphaproteobacteria bacterium]